MTNPTCHICGSSSRFLLTKDGYSLYQCPKCRLVFVSPQPSGDFLASKVYSKGSGYQGHKPKDLSQVTLTKAYAKVFSYLNNEGIKGKLLDIGCSNGEFLYPAKLRGFEVRGVELNPYTSEIARDNGLEVFTGTLSDARSKPGFEEESFDVIFLGDLIEHVGDPRALLVECQSLLAPNGKIIISTPNLDCFWARATFALHKLLKIPWSSVTPPHHLFQFSRGNLITLMSQCGLGYETTWYNRRPSLFYERGQTHLVREWRARKGLKKLFFGIYMAVSLSLYAIFYYLADLIGLFVIKKDFGMVVVAAKRAVVA